MPKGGRPAEGGGRNKKGTRGAQGREAPAAPPPPKPQKPGRAKNIQHGSGTPDELLQISRPKPKPTPKATAPKEGTIQSLPLHVLEVVLSNLGAVELAKVSGTSRDFLSTADIALRRSTRVMDRSAIPLDPAAVRWLARRGSHITKVCLDHTRALSCGELEALAEGCPLVEHLSLRVCSRIRDEGLCAVARRCRLLSHLDVTECRLLTGLPFERLGEGGAPLEVLRVAGCPSVGDEALRGLLLSSPPLRELCVAGTGAAGGCLAALDSCPGITALDVSHCAAVEEAMVWGVGSSCPLLARLDLSGLQDVGPYLVARTLDLCPGLVELAADDCPDFTDHAAAAAVQRCPLLEGLSVAGCPSFTAAGLREVVRRQGQRLTSLDISFCGKVGEETMTVLAQSCPLLRKISSRGLDTASEGWLTSLGVFCPHLQHLDVSGCINVTDVGIGHLCMGAKGLRSLHLRNCGRLSTIGLRSIGRLCPNLESLDIGGIPSVSDGGLAEIVAGCPALTALDISRCWKITDDGVCAVGHFCRQLRVLRMLGCEGPQGVGVRRVKRLCAFLVELSTGPAK